MSKKINMQKKPQAKVAGISELVSALILIAIAIVGGFLIYKVFMGYATTLTTYHSVEITSATLTASPSMLILNIQNTGNVQVKAFTVYINGYQVNMSLAPLPLPGGGVASGVTHQLPINITSGQSYVVLVRAVFSDNSSSITETTVVASQG